MATYYMRADGTAANKAAATGPAGTQSACMNVAVHNAQTFSDGDIILLSDQGGNFLSQIVPPSSGTSIGITYKNVDGESPTIDAGIVPTTAWTGPDGNEVWTATVPRWYPKGIYYDNLPVALPKTKSTSSACSDGGNWYYTDSGTPTTIYFKPGTDIDPNDHRITLNYYAGTGDGLSYHALFNCTSKSYLIIDGLTFLNGDGPIWSYTDTVSMSNITIKNCTFNYGNAAVFFANTNTMSYITFHDNTIYRCRTGFKAYGSPTKSNFNVYNNTFTEVGTTNGTTTWETGDVWADDESIGVQNITDSNFYNNTMNGGFTLAFNIFAASGGTVANNKIYNNFVYDNRCMAIYFGGSGAYAHNNNKIYNNILINCGRSGVSMGVYVIEYCQGSGGSQQNYIYNNTIYGYSNTFPFYLFPDATTTKYVTIKNNIIYNYGTYSIINYKVDSNFVMDYNCWGADSKFYVGASNPLHTLAELIEDGYETHGMAPANPLFVNAGGATAADYKLQSGSPCIGAGIQVGATPMLDYEGKGMYNETGGVSIGAYRGWTTGSHNLPGN